MHVRESQLFGLTGCPGTADLREWLNFNKILNKRRTKTMTTTTTTTAMRTTTWFSRSTAGSYLEARQIINAIISVSILVVIDEFERMPLMLEREPM